MLNIECNTNYIYYIINHVMVIAPGIFTRPACFFLLSTMAVATLMHIKSGDPFVKYSHALEAAILFFSLLFIGPGKISLDEKLSKKKKSA